MNNQDLAKLATSNENTPELGQYWQKRYEKFLKNNVFILSEKTQSLLDQKELIDSPATPYGYLNLPIFLGKNKIVDEVMLQNCIETAIRFLDSVLDVINFSPEARLLINQNRKIGLGVTNFEEYLTNREATSTVEEIDYIGEIISSSSYRASEALAEEKGSCDNWNSLAMTIRPKAFEYWYNNETGEVKSGLDIAEEFTSTNLVSSHFEIIPRRNSHILLYPNNQEWQIWSDRDDNSIIAAAPSSKVKTDEAPIISTGQDDDNDYMPSFEQETTKNNFESPIASENKNEPSDAKDSNSNSQQFTNPAPIQDLPLINPISTLQQKISKWFAVDGSGVETLNPVDLSKDSQEIKKTNNDLPIPKVNEEPKIVTQIKEVPVEVIKEINKPILVQIVTLSSEAKKILVDKNSQLPTVEYCFEKDIETEVIEKINQHFGVQIDFMEISSVDVYESQIYIVYQAKIHQLQDDNEFLHYDFIEALSMEQDTVAYSKSIDRVHRWQQSAKIKAQELLKEYNQNQEIETSKNESKIITQKNLFIEELQTRIQKLTSENIDIETSKNQEIETLNSDLEATKLKLEATINKSSVVEKPIEQDQSLNQEIEHEAKVILVKNDDLMFDLNSQPTADKQTIPTININTNNMPQNQDLQSEVEANQSTFRTSRDKMFMPTLEIETKLGVPVIINAHKTDDVIVASQPTITEDTNPKSPSHAANVLLKLKRLTR
jgi:hypothetical protein